VPWVRVGALVLAIGLYLGVDVFGFLRPPARPVLHVGSVLLLATAALIGRDRSWPAYGVAGGGMVARPRPRHIAALSLWLVEGYAVGGFLVSWSSGSNEVPELEIFVYAGWLFLFPFVFLFLWVAWRVLAAFKAPAREA
jgi:hypothetical protein